MMAMAWRSLAVPKSDRRVANKPNAELWQGVPDYVPKHISDDWNGSSPKQH